MSALRFEECVHVFCPSFNTERNTLLNSEGLQLALGTEVPNEPGGFDASGFCVEGCFEGVCSFYLFTSIIPARKLIHAGTNHSALFGQVIEDASPQDSCRRPTRRDCLQNSLWTGTRRDSLRVLLGTPGVLGEEYRRGELLT